MVMSCACVTTTTTTRKRGNRKEGAMASIVNSYTHLHNGRARGRTLTDDGIGLLGHFCKIAVVRRIVGVRETPAEMQAGEKVPKLHHADGREHLDRCTRARKKICPSTETNARQSRKSGRRSPVDFPRQKSVGGVKGRLWRWRFWSDVLVFLVREAEKPRSPVSVESCSCERGMQKWVRKRWIHMQATVGHHPSGPS